MATVEYTETAVDQLDRLDPDTAERILGKVEEASEWPAHHLDRLTGWPYYSLRIGDYRPILSWDLGEGLLTVEAVGHRRNVYDRHLPP